MTSLAKFNFKGLKSFFGFLYAKLFKINDTPQKVSIGFGLGVFLGIIPGTGPIAALVLAAMFGVNRASALLGSLITNTWLSLATFSLSVKLGSVILKVDGYHVYNDWLDFLRSFHWLDLFKLSILKIIYPVILGYFIVALGSGTLTYLITLTILIYLRKK